MPDRSAGAAGSRRRFVLTAVAGVAALVGFLFTERGSANRCCRSASSPRAIRCANAVTSWSTPRRAASSSCSSRSSRSRCTLAVCRRCCVAFPDGADAALVRSLGPPWRSASAAEFPAHRRAPPRRLGMLWMARINPGDSYGRRGAPAVSSSAWGPPGRLAGNRPALAAVESATLGRLSVNPPFHVSRTSRRPYSSVVAWLTGRASTAFFFCGDDPLLPYRRRGRRVLARPAA